MHREVVAPVVEACVGNLLAGRILDGDAVGVRPAGLQEQAGEEVLAAPGLRSTRWERRGTTSMLVGLGVRVSKIWKISKILQILLILQRRLCRCLDNATVRLLIDNNS